METPVVTWRYKSSNILSCVWFQDHILSDFISCCNCCKRSDRSGTNRLRYVKNPINLCRLFTSVGFYILPIASTFEGSGFSPSLVIKCPIYGISAQLNTDLSRPSLIFFSLHLFSSSTRLTSWSRCASLTVLPQPYTTMLSAMKITTTNPSRTSFRCFWKISEDTLIPNGNHNHLYLSKGVLKMTKRLDSLSSWICQKADARSSFVMFPLKALGFGSIQILNLLDFCRHST